jgi:hypothetical protein
LTKRQPGWQFAVDSAIREAAIRAEDAFIEEKR